GEKAQMADSATDTPAQCRTAGCRPLRQARRLTLRRLNLGWIFSRKGDRFYIMPEKNLNEMPRDLRDLYQKGSVALQRQNFEYAIAIFNQVLQREPGF